MVSKVSAALVAAQKDPELGRQSKESGEGRGIDYVLASNPVVKLRKKQVVG